MNDARDPCCEPTTFLQQGRTVKTLAASLRHFTRFIARFIPLPRSIRFYAVVWTASKAQLREERRERNPCRDPIRFYAVLYTLTLASG
jgi:hypothetical protein